MSFKAKPMKDDYLKLCTGNMSGTACVYQLEAAGVLPGPDAVTATVASTPTISPVQPGLGGMEWLGLLGVGFVVLVGAVVAATYRVKPDPTLRPIALLPPGPEPFNSQVNSPPVHLVNSPSVHQEFTTYSPEFTEPNPFEEGSPLEQVRADSFDPEKPVAPGEFAAFCALVRGGLSPKGNDILKVIWGVSPGKSNAYKSAVQKRRRFQEWLDNKEQLV